MAHELQATAGVTPESLGGWMADTIAAEAADQGCRADYAACERLRALTAGLPLYVQNALQQQIQDLQRTSAGGNGVGASVSDSPPSSQSN